MLTREQFLEHIRSALNHLYDPDRLCRSPLVNLFGVAQKPATFSALQKILLEAIAALEPPPDTPPQERAWRIYELLFFRYVQQNTVHSVADQLGLTMRHLRREQRAALEALAYQLWQQYRLDAQTDETQPAARAGPSISEELNWLRNAPPKQPADLGQVLATALDLAKPLATRYGSCLEISAAGPLPAVAAHETALIHALLNLLSAAIPRAAQGAVRISAQPLPGKVEVRVQCTASPGSRAQGAAASLDMARQLAALCGSELHLDVSAGNLEGMLALPVFQQVLVLVIDDNADALQLFERYTAGTPYRLTTTRDPAQAPALAAEIQPQIIVLDVMMPHVDGWRVLAQLRQHAVTSSTPVIVCTILPQEELALSLGASGFVRKPVTQEAFLTALDRQATSMVPGLH